MRLILLFSFFLVYTFTFSQEKTTHSFEFEGEKIEYTEIDYSKYSVLHFDVIMYENISKYNTIESSIVNCLESKKNLFHTYFFILKIDSKYKEEETKEKIFDQFITHLLGEKFNNTSIPKGFSVNLNFDKDYSKLYRQETLKHKQLPKVSQIFTDISPKTICKALFTTISKTED